jgi:hypothetical protein
MVHKILFLIDAATGAAWHVICIIDCRAMAGGQPGPSQDLMQELSGMLV